MKIKEIETLCQGVIDDNPKKVQKYKEGYLGFLGLFTGEVMIRSRGKADPKEITVILKELLK